ncbi:MAG: SDR family oxidoreductase [Paracoccaceae bacterium]
MAESLNGKIAAVTGAASGIGLATVRALLAEGATVVMVDWNASELDKLAAELGDKAVPQVTNLLDAESCKAMIPEILAKVDHIDILHLNAGTYIGGDLIDTDSDTIDRMLNLNVNAVMKNVREVIPHMVARGTGDIIVTASVAGHMQIAWEPVYSSSKWAVTTFVQTMRRQLNKKGIRVAQVSPGPWSRPCSPIGRPTGCRPPRTRSLMEPEEVSDAVIYMLKRPRTVTIRDMIILPTNFDI